MSIFNFIANQLRHPQKSFAPILNVGNSQMIKECLKSLELMPHDNYLDVGFGGGKTLQLANKILPPHQIYGVDPSHDMVNRQINQGFKIYCARAEELPFKQNSMEKISSINTVYFFSDLSVIFSELHRVMKSDALLVLGLSSRDKLKRFRAITQCFRFWSEEQLSQQLSQNGFVYNIEPITGALSTPGDLKIVARKL